MKTFYQNYDYENPTEEMKYPYRHGKTLKVAKHGIEKTTGKTLTTFKGFYMTMRCVAHPKAFFALMRFLLNMAGLFFFPQHFRKWHLLKTPIKHVDHAIDEKIPFRPNKYPVYMNFIPMWMHPMGMIFKRYTYNSSANIALEWFSYLALIYPEAGKLYYYTMTTTYRPATDDKKILGLRKTDPHYMCVPSLHITTIALAFCFYRMLFERENFGQEDKQLWNKEIFDTAVEIGESVLYVKQHSVNCIPAGLFMLRKIAPELCTDKEVYEFLEAMFLNSDDVNQDDRIEAYNHMKNLYDKFVEEGKNDSDWSVPVKKWLDSYQPHTPSYNC